MELGHNEHDVLDFLPLNILCLVKAMVNGLYDYITEIKNKINFGIIHALLPIN